MKAKLVLVGLLLIGFAHSTLAQQQTQSSQDATTVIVKKSDLTAEQLAKVQSQQVKERLGEYGEYAEMGRGIGLAVSESLKAGDVAVNFSKTDVGKFTMFLIAWKVMAKDIISVGDVVFGYLVGIPLLFLGGLVLLWSYRRQCLPGKVLVEKTKEGRKWAVIAPNGQKVDIGDMRVPHYVEGRAVWAVGHVAVGALFLIFCSFMIFGCNP